MFNISQLKNMRVVGPETGLTPKPVSPPTCVAFEPISRSSRCLQSRPAHSHFPSSLASPSLPSAFSPSIPFLPGSLLPPWGLLESSFLCREGAAGECGPFGQKSGAPRELRMLLCASSPGLCCRPEADSDSGQEQSMQFGVEFSEERSFDVQTLTFSLW